ncbi:MAG: M28 family peptidase [Candidatus Hydrogenedentes bacterium]|nr:M28 family peptidase [Candidatus Hydrogenedentota bacterium]
MKAFSYRIRFPRSTQSRTHSAGLLHAAGAAVLWVAGAAVWCDDVSDSDASSETRLLSKVRQLTFEGLRAGEGYFSADGTKLVFQSERMAENPWYQIYLMDLETGDVDRVSPGHGKTTCAWIHPEGEKVLFASTHEDPQSEALQQAELDFRASGQERRYSWDYDEHFDLFETDFKGRHYTNLTKARGYDAEGSYSPDGSKIAFASNRHAYTEALSEEDAEIFEKDLSYMMDIYIMDADGSNLKRLTNVKGYDGGPFFSPNGERIVWRRFAPNGATAEVYTMNIDGSDQRQITRVGVMSWAPYYHPSGDYLIFTNNSLGFANFELFMVDVEGRREAVRVTFTEGFDGLPVFSPDGNRLAWTTNRPASGKSQIFLADWDDKAARRLLGLHELAEVQLEGAPEFAATASAIRAADLKQHVVYLASDYMEGRRTGTVGERRATAYVAEVFREMGLEPAGDAGTYFQEFEFTAGVSLGAASRLTLNDTEDFAAGEAWRPLAFSKTGSIEPSGVVFAGYGIQAPKGEGDIGEYDSFAHLDVTDKWVMAFRYMPEDISAEMRQHLSTHSSLRYKAMTIRDLGGRGLILVSGPNSGVKNELVPLFFDTSLGETSVAAISITDAAAQSILNLADQDLKSLQDAIDDGSLQMGFEIPDATLSAQIDIEQETRIGRNVLARLYAGDSKGESAIAIGAHVDHLGVGRSGSSLARDDEADAVHYGADDNASGVAGVLEIAQYMVDQKAKGLDMQRDAIFAAWSGEELGLLGANYFTRTYLEDEKALLPPHMVAYLNMDMIGRLENEVIVQGVASSSIWPGEIERRSIPADVTVNAHDEAYLPTDATSFYLKGVPFISAFTGAHEDYHTPRDTADKVNYGGAARIAKFMGLVARSLLARDEAPDYLEVQRPENLEMRANLRAYLGTIPDYAAEVVGLKLSGVSAGGPADDAGLKQGDVIVELAGRKIENIYDYTFAIEALKIGLEIDVVVERGGERLTLKITPGSRE